MKRVLPELVLLLLPIFGCSRNPLPDQVAPAGLASPALEQAVKSFEQCLAPDRNGRQAIAQAGAAVGSHQLVLTRLDRQPNRTTVSLAAWSQHGSSSLTLPLYTLSRGRWLLGETERVYLIDQECRRYGLLDVSFPARRVSPGTVRLSPGQVVEGELIFPPLGPRARLGALIYGERTLVTLFPPDQPPPAPNATGSTPGYSPR